MAAAQKSAQIAESVSQKKTRSLEEVESGSSLQRFHIVLKSEALNALELELGLDAEPCLDATGFLPSIPSILSIGSISTLRSESYLRSSGFFGLLPTNSAPYKNQMPARTADLRRKS